jgi:membrane fusion protein, multidrug efflux system
MNPTETIADTENGQKSISADASETPDASEALREIERLRADLTVLRHEQQEALRRSPGPSQPEISEDNDGEDAENRGVKRTRARRRGLLRLTAGLLALPLLCIGALRGWNYFTSYEWTDDAQIDGHLNPISSRINGTVVRVYVEDTQHVKAGEPLVDIDPRDYRVAVEQARGDLDEAQAALKAAQQEYQVAQARLTQGRATNVKAQRDVERYRELFASEVISREQYEEQIKVGKVDAAEVTLDSATLAGAAKVIAQRQAAIQTARAALDQALLNLSYTHIVAPVSGVIGEKTVEVGQRVQPGEEMLAIVPLDDIWVTANFRETQLHKMRRGLPVTIHVDATGLDYSGYVQGLPGASGELYSLLPPENATGNYVKVVQRLPVRIRFDAGQDTHHRLRPGISVEPTVWLNAK